VTKRSVPIPKIRWRSNGGPTAAETASYKADKFLRGLCADCNRAAKIKPNGNRMRKCPRCLRLDRDRHNQKRAGGRIG
jgi:hypothetical protein